MSVAHVRPGRARTVAATMIAAAVLGTSTLAFVAAPASAQPSPEPPEAATSAVASVTVSKTANIDRAGETLTVTGTGFDAAGNIGTRAPLKDKPAGAYVIFGKFDDTWKPSASAPSSSRRVVKQVWALPEPSYTAMGGAATAGLALMQADGSFSITIDVAPDARSGNYGIYTYPGSGALNAGDETATPLTFAPGVTVSKATNLNRAGETITASVDGISTTGNTGTRPPLKDKPAGAYVIFGKFDDVWKPSASAPSSSRRVVKQVWALPEPSYTAMGGAATAGLALLKPDGSVTVSLDVSLSSTVGNYGVYVYPGSGAVNAANELEQRVGFAPIVPDAPAIGTASPGAGRATVSWTAPAPELHAPTPVTGYVVTPYAGAIAGTPVEVAGTETSAVVEGLDDGTAYTFQVAAKNVAGTGAPSAASNEVTPQAFLPWSTATVAVTEITTWMTGKAPTAAVLEQWVPDLESGDATVASLVASIRSGTDATANVNPATRLYSAYLTRVPDKGGLDFWVNRRRNGWTLFRISSHFAGSNEFTTRYGSLTNQQFVQLVYTNVMGRPADPGGLSYWTNKLNNGSVGRGQVMISFSESNEYKTTTAKQVDAAVVYISLIGRAPSTVERDAFVAALAGGASFEEVVADLIAAPSFADRAG